MHDESTFAHEPRISAFISDFTEITFIIMTYGYSIFTCQVHLCCVATTDINTI